MGQDGRRSPATVACSLMPGAAPPRSPTPTAASVCVRGSARASAPPGDRDHVRARERGRLAGQALLSEHAGGDVGQGGGDCGRLSTRKGVSSPRTASSRRQRSVATFGVETTIHPPGETSLAASRRVLHGAWRCSITSTSMTLSAGASAPICSPATVLKSTSARRSSSSQSIGSSPASPAGLQRSRSSSADRRARNRCPASAGRPAGARPRGPRRRSAPSTPRRRQAGLSRWASRLPRSSRGRPEHIPASLRSERVRGGQRSRRPGGRPPARERPDREPSRTGDDPVGDARRRRRVDAPEHPRRRRGRAIRVRAGVLRRRPVGRELAEEGFAVTVLDVGRLASAAPLRRHGAAARGDHACAPPGADPQLVGQNPALRLVARRRSRACPTRVVWWQQSIPTAARLDRAARRCSPRARSSATPRPPARARRRMLPRAATCSSIAAGRRPPAARRRRACGDRAAARRAGGRDRRAPAAVEGPGPAAARPGAPARARASSFTLLIVGGDA